MLIFAELAKCIRAAYCQYTQGFCGERQEPLLNNWLTGVNNHKSILPDTFGESSGRLKLLSRVR